MRLIPHERIRQRTVEQIDDARATGRGKGCGSGPDHSPGAYSVAMQRQVPTAQTVQRTVKVLQEQVPD